MGKVLGLSFIGALIFSVVIVINQWHISQDITGWQQRAQVSSDPNDMLEYMQNVKSGMDKWGMTNGYAALFFTTPGNDMLLIHKAVERHIALATELTTMDKSTTQYQTGLDNLRGQIRELDIQAGYYWDVHAGLIYWLLAIVFWLVVVFSLAAY